MIQILKDLNCCRVLPLKCENQLPIKYNLNIKYLCIIYASIYTSFSERLKYNLFKQNSVLNFCNGH